MDIKMFRPFRRFSTKRDAKRQDSSSSSTSTTNTTTTTTTSTTNSSHTADTNSVAANGTTTAAIQPHHHQRNHTHHYNHSHHHHTTKPAVVSGRTDDSTPHTHGSSGTKANHPLSNSHGSIKGSSATDDDPKVILRSKVNGTACSGGGSGGAGGGGGKGKTGESPQDGNTPVKLRPHNVNKHENASKRRSWFHLHGSSKSLGIVHENPKIGSDGESEEVSVTSEDKEELVSPVKIRVRPRRFSEDINKRLSLPADMRLPESFLKNSSLCPTPDGPLNRRMRRASLSEIGFGKIESYTKLDKLGEGTYATVFKGKSKLTDEVVALKEIRLEHEEGAPCTAIREVSLLRDLRHANIVTLHDIIHTNKSLTLVFEYLDRDLKQYMDDCGNILNMTNVKYFLFQLLRGLAYCHKRHVLHRDLKPQNLLINDAGELKLADFGLARAKSIPTKTYSHEVVTLWYRPPDVLLGSTDYSTPIDMWGVGCIFYEMACGRPLFPGSTVEDELDLIFRVLGTPTSTTWPEVVQNPQFISLQFPFHRKEPLINQAPRLDADGLDLFSQFLQYNAKSRMSASAGLKHPYFNSLGPRVHTIPDTGSIFDLPGIKLQKDPGLRSSAVSSSGSRRRQSMLF